MPGSEHKLVSSRARLLLLHTLSDMQNLVLPTVKTILNLRQPFWPYPTHAALATALLRGWCKPISPSLTQVWFVSTRGFLERNHRNHIIAQNLDCPVSLETSSLFLSRTRMASLPYCEYHILRLRLR